MISRSIVSLLALLVGATALAQDDGSSPEPTSVDEVPVDLAPEGAEASSAEETPTEAAPEGTEGESAIEAPTPEEPPAAVEPPPPEPAAAPVEVASEPSASEPSPEDPPTAVEEGPRRRAPRFAAARRPAEPPPKGAYRGLFDQAPVPHWRIRLPGTRMSSAAHTERSRPVVVGERIYVGSAAGDGLYVLSRRDGTVIRKLPARNSVESEPVVLDDKVYFADTGGTTWCYTTDGKLVWSHDSRAPILVRPTLHEGTLFITNVEDLAVALDAETGELRWRYQQKPDLTRRAELSLYGAPPAVIDGDQVLLGFSDGTLASVAAATGEFEWSRRVGEGRYPDLIAEPVVEDGVVFAAGYYEPFVALDQATRNTRWSFDHGAASGVTLDRGEGYERLYLPGSDGDLRAVDARTGERIWEWSSGTNGALTRPVVTPAGLLVASSAGTISLVDPVDGVETWSFRPGYQLEGISAPPTVAGRQLLFVTNAGFLHSMIAPARNAPWPPENRIDPLWERPRERRSGI